MQVVDYGQGPCYKCGSKARVRTIRYFIFRELYGVCCTKPECGESTSRKFLWRCNAVKAWNRKPTVCDLLVDRILNKVDTFFEKLEKKSEKERDD